MLWQHFLHQFPNTDTRLWRSNEDSFMQAGTVREVMEGTAAAHAIVAPGSRAWHMALEPAVALVSSKSSETEYVADEIEVMVWPQPPLSEAEASAVRLRWICGGEESPAEVEWCQGGWRCVVRRPRSATTLAVLALVADDAPVPQQPTVLACATLPTVLDSEAARATVVELGEAMRADREAGEVDEGLSAFLEDLAAVVEAASRASVEDDAGMVWPEDVWLPLWEFACDQGWANVAHLLAELRCAAGTAAGELAPHVSATARTGGGALARAAAYLDASTSQQSLFGLRFIDGATEDEFRLTHYVSCLDREVMFFWTHALVCWVEVPRMFHLSLPMAGILQWMVYCVHSTIRALALTYCVRLKRAHGADAAMRSVAVRQCKRMSWVLPAMHVWQMFVMGALWNPMMQEKPLLPIISTWFHDLGCGLSTVLCWEAAASIHVWFVTQLFYAPAIFSGRSWQTNAGIMVTALLGLCLLYRVHYGVERRARVRFARERREKARAATAYGRTSTAASGSGTAKWSAKSSKED